MTRDTSIFQDLLPHELEQIKRQAVERQYKKDEIIFSEGDSADCIYFVESGEVAITVQKFTTQEEISILGPGDYFGEMAMLNEGRRTATVVARENAMLLSIDKTDFIQLMENNPLLAERINTLLAARNEELLLKESLVDFIGIKGKNLHVSIKGDPSLRESAFMRERYESPVDKILLKLQPVLTDLLTQRSVYQIFVGFNSGEIRTLSIYDPFYEVIHQASKLLDRAYIERHFPIVTFEDKSNLVKNLYQVIETSSSFSALPSHISKILREYYRHWEPVSPDDIVKTITELETLRGIPNFYLRNITISLARDAIRMQFNCDGTHIVNATEYQHFLEENIID